jgi:hypothetical protein
VSSGPAPKKTGVFVYDHPALVATIAAALIGGAFLFALKQSAAGHHGPSTHGSGAASASAAPSGKAAPPATSAKK